MDFYVIIRFLVNRSRSGMPMMQAGIYYGPCDIRLEDIEVPPLQTTHVLVDTKSSGICGSDLHRYYGRWDQPDTKVATGHELSGVVIDVGDQVSGIEVGDRVCAECFSHCGVCSYCRIGLYNLCDEIQYLSRVGPGGFAEYALLAGTSLFKLPTAVTFEEGALVEPLAVAYRAVTQAQVISQDTVAILGAGTVGLLCLAVAKSMGIHTTIISAKYAHQMRLAEKFGADHVLQADRQVIAREIEAITLRRGVDGVIDTIVAAQTFSEATHVVRKGGTICLVGGYTAPLNLFLGPIVSKELQIRGSSCYSYSGLDKDFDTAIDLIASKRVDALSIVTHRFPLHDIAQAFSVAADKTSGSIKVLLNQ
jgi:2-desacetyl-2-hydroxyethyl bacteriochlorophyllide A dehydrogenase